MKQFYYFTLACFLPLFSFADTFSGQIVEQGYIECFPENLQNDNGTPVWAGPSTAVFDGKHILIGNDLHIPGANFSTVFQIPYPSPTTIPQTPVVYLTHPLLSSTIKYEAGCVTPEGEYTFLTTPFGALGFDAMKPKDAFYERFFYFPTGCPQEVKLLNPGVIEGIPYTQNLRKSLAALFKSPLFPLGAPYINIEGLAAIPGNRLLFGLRQVGVDYNNNDNRFTIIETTYEIQEGVLKLCESFKIIYDISPAVLAKIVGKAVALSDMVYDKFRNCLWILSTYEMSDDGSDEDIGAFLWYLSLEDLAQGNPPKIVNKGATNEPLHFAHKMEGITLLNPNLLFVIADDDRILGRDFVQDPETQFSRKHNEGAYNLVEIETSKKGSLSTKLCKQQMRLKEM